MENLLFSLNATLPVFFTMLLGVLFRKVGLFDDALTAKLNRFVFQAGPARFCFFKIFPVRISMKCGTPRSCFSVLAPLC